MIQYFYLLSLLFYVNSTLCYCNRQETGRSGYRHRRRHVTEDRSGRFRRSKDESVNSRFDDRNAVQQFDVAGFILKNPTDAVDDEPYDLRIRKRSHTFGNYDYDNALTSDDYYKKRGNYPHMGPDNMFELKDANRITKNSNPKNREYDESENRDRFNHDNVKNVNHDENVPYPSHKPAKKCFPKNVKFPFFSHKQSAALDLKKNKKRKSFCLNCPKKTDDDEDKGTNDVNSNDMEKETNQEIKSKRIYRGSSGEEHLGADTVESSLRDEPSVRISSYFNYDIGFTGEDNKKESNFNTGTNSSPDSKDNPTLNKPCPNPKPAELKHLSDDTNTEAIEHIKNENITMPKHKQFSLKNLKFPFPFHKHSHKNPIQQFDLASFIQRNSEIVPDDVSPYEINIHERSRTSRMYPYKVEHRKCDDTNKDTQQYSNSFDKMMFPFFSHDQPQTIQQDKTGPRQLEKDYENIEVNEDSNEIENQDIPKLRLPKQCFCPLCKNIFLSNVNDSGKHSDSIDETEDKTNTQIKTKRSYLDYLCPNCKKRYHNHLRGKQSKVDIIHNSRQFYEKMNTLDNNTEEEQNTVETSEAGDRISREKRDDIDRERQLKELEAVEKKVQAVQVQVPRFNTVPSPESNEQ